ncbi:hypothetical protein MRX96_005589 [Rhipicephalus microplus]
MQQGRRVNNSAKLWGCERRIRRTQSCTRNRPRHVIFSFFRSLYFSLLEDLARVQCLRPRIWDERQGRGWLIEIRHQSGVPHGFVTRDRGAKRDSGWQPNRRAWDTPRSLARPPFLPSAEAIKSSPGHIEPNNAAAAASGRVSRGLVANCKP